MSADRLARVPNGQGRVMILQALSEIRAGIRAGHSSRALFDKLNARLAGMSYRQFCRYADRIRQRVQSPDLEVIQPNRPTPRAPLEVAAHFPAPASPPRSEARLILAPASTSQPAQVNSDGPKAPPRPRSFVRLGGLPDDNRDKLI